MYQHQSFHHRPSRSGSYFLPFLSLIILGLIVVLVFQIVDYFQEKRLQALENKAAIKMVAGRADMKIWGVDQWAQAVDGSILKEGDALRTAPGSRAILTLQNGSVVRLSSETEIELAALKTRDSEDEVSLSLKAGEAWLRRAEKDTVHTSFEVTTAHLKVNSLGTIFDVQKGIRETVHVLDGKVSAAVNVEDIENENKLRNADTVEIAFGQELSLGQEELLDLQNHRPVRFLSLLSDEFRKNEWYYWNRSEDLTGGVGVTVADAIQGQGTTQLPPKLSEETSPVEVTTTLTSPEIISPKEAEREITANSLVVSGTVSPLTQKIEVTTYVGGKAEPYTLQKYQSGQATWTYVLSNEYANLVPGINRYTIVAIGKDGSRSSPTEFVINYAKPKEPADLASPRVSNVEWLEDENVGIANGTIGKGIVKIYVNDFPLSRYVPNSGVWVYYAKTAYGNLKEGKNTYKVYGVDVEGNKTPVTEFIIVKNPKPETAPAPALAPAPAPAPL